MNDTMNNRASVLNVCRVPIYEYEDKQYYIHRAVLVPLPYKLKSDTFDMRKKCIH